MRYLWLLAFLGACKTERMNTPDAPGPPVDPWWQPKVGEAKNWDIQLKAPIDISTDRVMYDLDLWAVVPSATKIMYDDGSSLDVPAGSLATAISDLHGRSAKVICHINTGSLLLTELDASKFKGYKANPPDDPTPPEADSVVGWRNEDPMLRFLDIRTGSTATWEPLMWKRFDLAKDIGCDGIDADKIERGTDNSGWTTEFLDVQAFYTEVAKQAHMRKLSVGMHGGATTDLPDVTAPIFDWMMIERCGEQPDPFCDVSRPFINLQKDVFAIDYDHNFDGDPQAALGVCNQQQLAMISDGIYKDVALTKAVRTQCTP